MSFWWKLKRRNVYKAVIAYVMMASACFVGCAPTFGELVKQEEQATPNYYSLSELPYEKTLIGYNEDFKLGTKSPIAEFATGKSHFKAIELPPANEKYYMIVKSYFISSRTDGLFLNIRHPFSERTSHCTPFVFQPYIITMDENYKIIRTISYETFQLATNFKWQKYFFIYSIPKGNTWLQTLIPFSPDEKEKYAVILTSPELVKALTNWPNVLFASSRYWPISNDCIYNPGGGIRHSPIGKLRLSIISPKDIFLDQEKVINDLPEVAPGQTFQKKWFSVQSPDEKGFHIGEEENYDYISFKRVLPEGLGIMTMFIYYTKAQELSSGYNLWSFIDSAINEHSENLIDLSYSKSMITLDGAQCYRIDFKGKDRAAFLAPIEGYDIYCVPPKAENEKPMTVVRIGGNIGYSPATDEHGIPDQVNDFVTKIKFVDE